MEGIKKKKGSKTCQWFLKVTTAPSVEIVRVIPNDKVLYASLLYFHTSLKSAMMRFTYSKVLALLVGCWYQCVIDLTFCMLTPLNCAFQFFSLFSKIFMQSNVEICLTNSEYVNIYILKTHFSFYVRITFIFSSWLIDKNSCGKWYPLLKIPLENL